jgi:phospholipid/cholesterol/gamma-HCH transport system substrate-binding protein
MNEQIKNMLIGLFVVIACSLIVGIILFIEPSVGDGGQTIVVRFSNINGISVGTRVVFAGKPVGEVSEIEMIPEARDQPIDEWGNVFYYQLILKIDSHVRIYNTDEFTVVTSGLLGDKSVAIIPRAPAKHMTAKLLTDETPVYAASVDPLESAFNQLSGLSEKIGDAIDKIVSWFDENQDVLSQAVSSFDQAMAGIATTMDRVNELDVVSDVKRATNNFADTMGSARKALDTLDEEQTFQNAGIMVSHFKNTSASIDDVTSKMAKGEGTVGKLFMNDDTYLQINSLLSKADTTLNDINQYGLLFNMNKQWQRTRVKYAAWLDSLKTPEQFEAYFENQVDLINSAMGRLSMLIEKAEVNPDRTRIMNTPAFKKDFADLMQRVHALYENLKLYNQDLNTAIKESNPPKAP